MSSIRPAKFRCHSPEPLRHEGLTQSELEQALAKKFRSEYLKNPKVTVTIATLRPYYMMGEVKNPGEYPYKSGLNVLTAMAIAGGPTYRASRSTVQIQRRGETSMRDYPISASVPILPGDVIKVPERYFELPAHAAAHNRTSFPPQKFPSSPPGRTFSEARMRFQ